MSTISVFHSLGRSGGTIISRCLGAMESIILLSEIHPKGVELMSKAYGEITAALFSPTIQAKCWHQLLDPRLHKYDFLPSSTDQFLENIANIHTEVLSRKKTLVIRDWSFIDFVGFPFCEPVFRDSLSEILGGLFTLNHISLIRHPIDQWISIGKVPAFNEMPLHVFLTGYLSFLKLYEKHPIIKYEDFTLNPERTLKRMTNILDVKYDRDWNKKWTSYIKITGDEAAKRLEVKEIKIKPRPYVSDSFLHSIKQSVAYQEILEITGYKHPQTVDLGSTGKDIGYPAPT